MTKQYSIFELGDFGVYYITNIGAEFKSEKDANEVCNLLNNLYCEREMIKNKLINQILEYGKISYDNYSMGLSESVEAIIDEVEELFENPRKFKLLPSHYQCHNFKEYETDDYGLCKKFNEKKYMWEDTDCKEFEWK